MDIKGEMFYGHCFAHAGQLQASSQKMCTKR